MSYSFEVIKATTLDELAKQLSEISNRSDIEHVSVKHVEHNTNISALIKIIRKEVHPGW